MVAPGFKLQESPLIYLTAISGMWLLKRSTPSWRLKDPDKGFQRIVREDRARKIAVAVLDQGRTFPNAIVLATNIKSFAEENQKIAIPTEVKFLVVDGQHRLWAQKFSHNDAPYACLIHMGLKEEGMAKLFLEINDNQKRVPSSLRWDLVRLVRPDDDPYAIAASEMVYQLSTEDDSPMYQRIDLTGEQHELQIKQGSLAPDIKRLLQSKTPPINKLSYEEQYQLIIQYFIAIREIDSAQWGTQESKFYKARVLRALLRLMTDLVISESKGKSIINITYRDFLKHLRKINPASLDQQEIRAAQGSAGIKAIYEGIKKQVLS